MTPKLHNAHTKTATSHLKAESPSCAILDAELEGPVGLAAPSLEDSGATLWPKVGAAGFAILDPGCKTNARGKTQGKQDSEGS